MAVTLTPISGVFACMAPPSRNNGPVQSLRIGVFAEVKTFTCTGSKRNHTLGSGRRKQLAAGRGFPSATCRANAVWTQRDDEKLVVRSMQ